jgi:hypothetical protein
MCIVCVYWVDVCPSTGMGGMYVVSGTPLGILSNTPCSGMHTLGVHTTVGI